ncbi:MAG: type II CAAX endopeptidase family protein [Pseudoruegeria sp.]
MTQYQNSAYRPHDQFVDPARKMPQLWRLVVGLVIVGVLYLIAGTTLFTAVIGLSLNPSAMLAEAISGNPLITLALLIGFGFMTLGTMIAARLLHKRTPSTLIGPISIVITNFVLALIAALAMQLLVFLLPPYVMPPLIHNLAPPTWFALLAISLPALFIQVSAEEILFRGYIQQQLAARFRSPLIWMVLPSVLFAVGHYDPASSGENAVLMVLWALMFGLLAADLTARTGNLGAAIALHFVNNAFAILLIAPPGPLSGVALYTLPFELSELPLADPLILIDLGVVLCSWLAIRIALKV